MIYDASFKTIKKRCDATTSELWICSTCCSRLIFIAVHSVNRLYAALYITFLASPTMADAAAVPSIDDPVAFREWEVPFKTKRVEFQRQTADMPVDQIKKLNLHEYFGEIHMRQLWQDFNRKTVPECNSQTKALLTEARKPKAECTLAKPNKVKNTVLTLSLCLPKDKREEHCAVYSETISDKFSKGEKFDWIFEGEMLKTHGRKELNKLIRLNIYEREEVKKGLWRYRKTTQCGSAMSSYEKKTEVSKKADLDEAEANTMFNMLLQRAHSSGYGGKGGTGGNGFSGFSSAPLGGTQQLCDDDEVKDKDGEGEEEEEEEEEEDEDDDGSAKAQKQVDAKGIALQFTKKITDKVTKLMECAQQLEGEESATSLHEAIVEKIQKLETLLSDAKTTSAAKASTIDVRKAAKLFAACNEEIDAARRHEKNAKPYIKLDAAPTGGKQNAAGKKVGVAKAARAARARKAVAPAARAVKAKERHRRPRSPKAGTAKARKAQPHRKAKAKAKAKKANKARKVLSKAAAERKSHAPRRTAVSRDTSTALQSMQTRLTPLHYRIRYLYLGQ